MSILDKYALREMVVPTLAGMLVVFVMMMGNTLFYLISDLIRIKAGFFDAAEFLLLKTPSFAWMILPAGALFGCALAVTRLARDSELTMMRMAGISVRRIFLPIFFVGALMSVAHFMIQEKVTPWAETRSKNVLKRIFRTPAAPPIQANVFFKVENRTFHVQRVEKQGRKTILSKVMIFEVQPGDDYATLTTADEAVQEGNVWVLRNGITRKTDKNGFTDYEARFKEAKLDLRRPEIGMPEGQKSSEEMTAAELGKQIKVYGSTNTSIAGDWKTNYHFKLSIPFSCFLIMLCVAPLCLKYGRTGGFMGVLIGILVLAIYWNVIVFGKALGTASIIPPAVAGWSEVVIFSIAGVILMWKAE